MVQKQQQNVTLWLELEQPGPQRNLTRQVEGRGGRGGQPVGQRRLGEFFEDDERDRLFDRQDLLEGDATLIRKRGTQALVAGHDIGKSCLERTHFKLTFQTDSQRDVVGRRRTLQPIQEPQPRLCKR